MSIFEETGGALPGVAQDRLDTVSAAPWRPSSRAAEDRNTSASTLHVAEATKQVATLLDRDPAAHVSLDDPDAVTVLLGALGLDRPRLNGLGA